MLKNPWICPACRSIVSTRSAPAVVTKSATSLAVSGALSEQLAKELSGGAETGAVRVGGRVEDAACLIRILAGAPSEEDEQELRAAKRAKVPVVAVQTGTEDFEIPYVLATDVVKCRPGEGFPIDEIAATCRCCASPSPGR